MLLVGRNASLFTRQVAIWCAMQDRAIDRAELSTSADAEALTAYHPACRVPVLVCDDGTRLIETFAICDWLDETADKKRMIPAAGIARRDCLQRIALMKLAGDKLVALFGAKARQSEDAHLSKLRAQIRIGFEMLEARAPAEGFLGGTAPDGSDITLVCAWQMVAFMDEDMTAEGLPRLSAIVSLALSIPAIAETNPNQ
jgi:glutathione S-transferase